MNNKKMLLSYLQQSINEGKRLNNNLFENPQVQNRPPQTSSQTNNQTQGAQNTAAQTNNQNQTSQNRTSQTNSGGSLFDTIINTMQNTPGYEQARKKLEDDQKANDEKARLEAEVGKATARVSSAPPETNRPGIDVPHKYKNNNPLKPVSATDVGFGVGVPMVQGAVMGSAGGPVGAGIGALAGAAFGGAVIGGKVAANWWDRKQEEHNAKKFEEEQARNLQARREGGQLISDTQARIQAQQKAQKSAERERAERLGLPWTDEFGVVHNA